MATAPVSQFSHSAEEVINRELDGKVRSATASEQIASVYEINETAAWIKNGNYEKVALQFPDELLFDAVAIAGALESQLGFKPYILADTVHGSCCVDEVAAEHVEADCIVHYGQACLTKPRGRIPVRYVLEKFPFDLAHFSETLSSDSTLSLLKECLRPTPEDSQRSALVLIVDPAYCYVYDEILKLVSEFVYNSANFLCHENITLIPSCLNLPSATSENLLVEPETVMFSCRIMLPKGCNLASDCVFLYVGCENILLTNFLMAHPTCPFLSYLHASSETDKGSMRREAVNVNKFLRRRLFLVEKVKDARVIGIVVGTLGVANYLATLDRCKQLIKSAKRKFYIFSVGKINVAKLSNFPEVDIFVLISCPFNGLIFDSSEFYRPIVTPFELEVALAPDGHPWMASSGWCTDITASTSKSETSQTGDGLREERAETDVSLVTGKLRTVDMNNESSANIYAIGQIISRDEALQVQTYAAVDYFKNRSWKGLEEKIGETPAHPIKEGRRGIAGHYENEPT